MSKTEKSPSSTCRTLPPTPRSAGTPFAVPAPIALPQKWQRERPVRVGMRGLPTDLSLGVPRARLLRAKQRSGGADDIRPPQPLLIIPGCPAAQIGPGREVGDERAGGEIALAEGVEDWRFKCLLLIRTETFLLVSLTPIIGVRANVLLMTGVCISRTLSYKHCPVSSRSVGNNLKQKRAAAATNVEID